MCKRLADAKHVDGVTDLERDKCKDIEDARIEGKGPFRDKKHRIFRCNIYLRNISISNPFPHSPTHSLNITHRGPTVC